MRNLATIQTVVDIQPIPKYDKVEYAQVLGWWVIVKKDEFKVGDKCVYFEIDSKVPEKEVFEFLRSRDFKVKTLKMCSVVSQGLALSLSAFEEFKGKDLPVGKDVTEILGVIKYDPEGDKEAKLIAEKQANEKSKLKRFLMKHKWYRVLFGGQKAKGGFPSWIKKTDETRVQTMPFLFKQKDVPKLICTEKLDGTSTTWFYVNQKGWFKKAVFGVCSRNIYLKNIDTSVYWSMALKLEIEEVLKGIAKRTKAKTVVLQGEILGDKICGNKYQIKGFDFYAFNLVIDGIKMSTVKMQDLLDLFHIKTVPILDAQFTLPSASDEMVAYSNGKSVIAPNVLREGVVCRSEDNTISFKAVSPEWLLKFKE